MRVSSLVCLCSCSLVREVLLDDEDGGERGQQRCQREPEGGGTHVVAVDGGLAGPHGVGLDVDDVVLLQVVGRRGVHLAAGCQVDGVGPARAALLAEHEHLGAVAVDGQVAGHAQHVEDGGLVAVQQVAPRRLHLTQHGDGEVGELHRDDGILDEVPRDELLLDVGGDLLARHARDELGAEHGEVDAAVRPHGVAQHVLAAVERGVVPRHADLLPHLRQVEEGCELRVAAVDDDGELVHGADGDVPGHIEAVRVAGAQVLEIEHVLGRRAGAQQGEACQQQGME